MRHSLHLAGSKKIQQELVLPGKLDRFTSSPEERDTFRDVFAGLYTLDAREIDGNLVTKESFDQVVKDAIENPGKYVMKPHREGGGNNFYNKAISEALETMSPSDLAAYILMDRIVPPAQPAWMLRDGVVHQVRPLFVTMCLFVCYYVCIYYRFHYCWQDNCICELGCFGVFLAPLDPSTTTTTTLNESAGYLLRVKAAAVDEGGVAAGYAVLSAPKLV